MYPWDQYDNQEGERGKHREWRKRAPAAVIGNGEDVHERKSDDCVGELFNTWSVGIVGLQQTVHRRGGEDHQHPDPNQHHSGEEDRLIFTGTFNP
jgi:hypothetical protein